MLCCSRSLVSRARVLLSFPLPIKYRRASSYISTGAVSIFDGNGGFSNITNTLQLCERSRGFGTGGLSLLRRERRRPGNGRGSWCIAGPDSSRERLPFRSRQALHQGYAGTGSGSEDALTKHSFLRAASSQPPN